MNWALILPLLCYLLLLGAIALWTLRLRRQVEPGQESVYFYVGGRSLGWVALVFTIIATAASAGTFVGGPGLAYDQGYAFLFAGQVQVGAAFLLLGLVGKKFAIVGRKINAVTVSDFLRHRYDSPLVVILASVGIVLFLVSHMTAQVIGGTRVLEAITGISYNWLVVIFVGVVALYTAVGGFLAVVITDVIQGVAMLAGIAFIWIALLVTVGSLTNVSDGLLADHPELLTLPGPGGYDFNTLVSFSLMFGLLLPFLPQLLVRGMTYRDTKSMHRAMYVGPIMMLIVTVGFTALGPIARHFHPNAEVADMAVPQMIIELVPAPVAGIILAAPLAAVMSTVDSMVLIVSGAIGRDIYSNYINPKVSERKAAAIGSLASAVVGLVVLVLALTPPDTLQLLIIYATGGLEVVFFAPILFGLFWKRGNALGAKLSMLGGVGWYTAASYWVPEIALGMEPVLTSAVCSAGLYVFGSYIGKPPSRQSLVKFWGTQAEVDRVIHA